MEVPNRTAAALLACALAACEAEGPFVPEGYCDVPLPDVPTDVENLGDSNWETTEMRTLLAVPADFTVAAVPSTATRCDVPQNGAAVRIDRRTSDAEAGFPSTEARIAPLEAAMPDAQAVANAAKLAQAAASAQSAGSTSVMGPPFNAVCNGSTDDTAAIQAALTAANAAGGGHVLIPASTVISSALVIYSNTWLEVAPQATVIFKAGSAGNMLRNAALVAQRSVADAAITASSTTLTSPSAAFSPADVGRSVTIAGAGGGGAVFTATITGYTNPTTVTLGTAALSTAADAAMSIHDRDTSIRVSGGTWARGSASGTGCLSGCSDSNTLNFRHVDGLEVEDVRVTSGAGKYAISVGDVTKVIAQLLTFATVSDGIHVQGPASQVVIRDVYGTTGDDAVAFTALDYVLYADVGATSRTCSSRTSPPHPRRRS